MRIFTMLMLSGMLGLIGCSSENAAPVPENTEEPEDIVVHESGAAWHEDRMVLGRETYDQVCASCHDTGKMDAPLTGNPKDWSGRSNLWEAVLFEHAKTGYLEMPEKGGYPDLPEEAVEAAAEYMLTITFPEMPRD